LIIDRISHEIPYYRTYLKSVALHGVTVVNDPFYSSAHDRFSNACTITQMGLPHPRVVALPSHSYVEGLPETALRNLRYPIPWENHIAYLGGFPVVLYPVRDSSIRKAYILESYEDLWWAYNQTGEEPMMMREYLRWERYIRCLCIGPRHVLPVPYKPGVGWNAHYQHAPAYLSAPETEYIVSLANRINQALGYAINAIDFAILGDTVYVVDATNPVPAFDVSHLTPHLFDWVVTAMVEFALELVQHTGSQRNLLLWSSELTTTSP
jgi:hypothetical protein